MSEHDTSNSWVRRCAQRLQWRHGMTPDVATELATETFACVGSDGGCPERAADEMLRMPMEV